MRTPTENLARGLPRSVIESFVEMDAPWTLSPWERTHFMQEFIEAGIVSAVEDPPYFSIRIAYYLEVRLCSFPFYLPHQH